LQEVRLISEIAEVRFVLKIFSTSAPRLRGLNITRAILILQKTLFSQIILIIIMEKVWSAAVEAWAIKPMEGQFSDAEDEPKVNVANLEIKDAKAFKASRGGQRGGHVGRGGRDQSCAGRGCFKCDQEGHFFSECPNHSLVVAFRTKCLNCGRKGHFSHDCLNPICFKCGEEGLFAYKCPSKSQGSVYIRIPGKSSGKAVLDGDTKCSKCGEQDNLSRNCPKCAKCFRCQEKGHFKRDCPQV
jgi:hypothetical protein